MITPDDTMLALEDTEPVELIDEGEPTADEHTDALAHLCGDHPDTSQEV